MRVFWSEQKARPQWLEHSPLDGSIIGVVLGANFLPDSQIGTGKR
jgi:hypothetical protein